MFLQNRRCAAALVVIFIALGGCDQVSDPADSAAPAVVGDLHADRVGVNSVMLRWTAPGDDGTNGRSARYDLRLSTGNLDVTTYALATVVTPVPVPASSGAPESLFVAGLEENRVYSFGLRTADEVPNWSPLSNIAVVTTLGAAPAAVADLAVPLVTLHSATLRWSAPSDNGSANPVAAYDLRYSTTPVTDGNWEGASVVPAGALPAPGSSGTQEQCVVHGLPILTQLYFGLRSQDAASNVSSISNVATATTDRPGSENEAIEALLAYYTRRQVEAYAGLLAAAGDHASFRFYLNEPLTDGTDSWDADEEVRIHRRMFDPAAISPGDPPLPVELWLVSVDAVLTPHSSWDERAQYYRHPVANPDGVDPVRWQVTGADFSHTVFFETQGDTDYRVEGRNEFVVLEDLALQVGEPRKFLLYRWNDRGSDAAGHLSAPSTWSRLKSLYR